MNFFSVSSDGRITQWTIVKVNTIVLLKKPIGIADVFVGFFTNRFVFFLCRVS